MIATEIKNGQGLGNQLWCYVVTRVIALDRGYSFGILHPERFKCLDFMELDVGMPVESLPYCYSERATLHPKNGADVRSFDPNLVTIEDGTKIEGLMQDERYIAHRKNEIREWLRVRPEFESPEYASDDMCVINFRGGEYVRVREVFLTKKYWSDAIARMRTENPSMRFVVVTDDVPTAKKFFTDFEVRHQSISNDYSIVAQAHYLILSNSSFAWFPAWLNAQVRLVIAPKYWAHHNVSDGYWSTGGAITHGWMYLNREGHLDDATTCRAELDAYEKSHLEIYAEPKIRDNFLFVSNYHNDLSWVPVYTDAYAIYDQSFPSILPPQMDPAKITPSEHRGDNIRDYCSFIIDQYDSLPERTIFCTGNVFPRHVTQPRFNALMNATEFTPIFEPSRHTPRRPTEHVTQDGLYAEYNDSWYLRHHPTKYFHSYDDFLNFVFEKPTVQKYVKFAPGANYVVPKENILKYPKAFYENLRLLVSHTDAAIPGESHIIERALYTIWKGDYAASEAMLHPLRQDFVGIPKAKGLPKIGSLYRKAAGAIYFTHDKIQYLIKKTPSLMHYFNGKRDIKTLWTRPEVAGLARLRGKMQTAQRLARKLKGRVVSLAKDTVKDRLGRMQFSSPEDRRRLAEVMRFPILDSDALQAKCDYSFGDHSGVIGHVPHAYMKKANPANTEFAEQVRSHTGDVMTLFIDNIRLYRRPHPFKDWLDMKPVTEADKAWLATFADEDLLDLCAQFPEKKFIIFTALEDRPLEPGIKDRIPENVLAIHAANAVYFGGKVHPYPHGLERRMYRGYNHHAILKRFLLDERPATKLLYVNHRNDTGDRGSLYALFSRKPWVTVSPRVDYTTYLSGIKDHKFVLCPSGNGIESARNWETLYMRRVPVFKRHPCLEELFKEFPAVFVDDWSEVTEELLRKNEHLYNEAQKTSMDKLNLDVVFSKRTTI